MTPGFRTLVQAAGLLAAVSSTALAQPIVLIDATAGGTQPVVISGAAGDPAATANAGISQVVAYAAPSNGAAWVLLGNATLGIYRPDMAVYGAQYTYSGWQLVVRGVAPGSYTLVVYAVSAINGGIGQAQSVNFALANDVRFLVELPSTSPAVQPFQLRGAVADLAAAPTVGEPPGVGIDDSSAGGVWGVFNRIVNGAYVESVWRRTTYRVPRPDLASLVGNAQFTNIGFTLDVTGLAYGLYDIDIVVRSTVSGGIHSTRIQRTVLLGKLNPPTASPGPGAFVGNPTVTLTAPSPATSQRVSFDGDPSTPVSAGPTTFRVVYPPVTVYARAVASGWADSDLAQFAYTPKLPTPTLSPNGGTYNAPVNVTVTAAGATSGLYTLNGPNATPDVPVPSNPIIVVDRTATLKVIAYGTNIAPSDPAMATYTLQPVAPTISPGTATYATIQTVTLATVTAGTTIRYTLNGPDPTETTGTLYSGPFPISTTSTLRARAFRTNWTGSATSTAIFTYNFVDPTPPTISASLSTPAGPSGWHAAAVTVSFTCADAESGVPTCPSPVTVSTAGTTRVTGTAVNGAGGTASVSVVVRLDLTPPNVSVLSPATDDLLPAGTTSTAVRVAAHDVYSGIDPAVVTCNGTAATAAGAVFTCANMALTAGANTVTVQGADRVGRTATAIATFYVGSGAPAATAITVSPAATTLIAGETRDVRVADDRGRTVTSGTWTTSAPAVATVSVASGVATLQAVAAGTATLTVQTGGLTSTATVTVLAAGATISDGTTLWSLASEGGGATTPKRADVLRATANPAFPPEAQPGLFFVDEGMEWSGAQLTRGPSNRPTRVRAVSLDGRELWEHRFTGRLVRHVAADQYGGVVIVRASGADTLGGAWQLDSLVKVDGLTGRTVWAAYTREEYAHFGEVAIHPNGTVYVVEVGDYEASRLRAFDGASGAEQAWDLPTGSVPDGPTAANVAGPIIREDGAVTLVARMRSGTGAGTTAAVSLATLAEGATAPSYAPVSLAAYASSAQVPIYLEDYRLLPDGQGGLLLGHRATDQVMRVSSSLALSPPVTLTATSGTKYETEYVLGDDHAYALVQEGVGTSYTSKVVGFNATTLALEGAVTTVATGATPTHYRLKYAMATSGVFVSGPSGGNLMPVVSGLWAGLTLSPSLAAGGPSNEAIGTWRSSQGTARRTNAWADWFKTTEEAALAGLDFLRLYSDRWEWGGYVCRRNDRFLWSRLVTSRQAGSVDVEALTHCADAMTPVARFHTHTPPPVGETFPSGVTTLTAPSDVSTADATHNRNLIFYVSAPRANITPATYRPLMYFYLAGSTSPSSRCHVFEYQSAPGSWLHLPQSGCQ